MIWRVFRRRAGTNGDEAWWRQADAVAAAPSPQALLNLRAMPPPPPDEAEHREEMLDGLAALVVLAGATALPTLETQHRVIGAEACHLAVPATLIAGEGRPGKLFLTASRLVFAAGRADSWPWHRIRQTSRAGRDLLVVGVHEAADLRLQCNSYGDALAAWHMAERLRRRAGTRPAAHGTLAD